jgi:hypothetical protein
LTSRSASDWFQPWLSPERINPRDNQHRLETIVKIVARNSRIYPPPAREALQIRGKKL